MKISTKVWLSAALLSTIFNSQAFERDQFKDFDFKSNHHKVVTQKVGKRVIKTHYWLGATPSSKLINECVHLNAEAKTRIRQAKKDKETGLTKEQRKEAKGQKTTDTKNLKNTSKPKLSNSYLKDVNLLVGKEVYDQGALGSCTATALAQIIKYSSSYLSVDEQTGMISLRDQPNLSNPMCLRISRLAQYLYSRQIMNSVDSTFLNLPLRWSSDHIRRWNSFVGQDTGASLEDAMLAFDSMGCIPESRTVINQGPFTVSSAGIPYNIRNFRNRPSSQDVFFSKSSCYASDLSEVGCLKEDNGTIDSQTTIATLLKESQEINPNQASQIAKKLFYPPSLNPYYIAPKIIQYKNILGQSLDETLLNIQTEISKNRPIYLGFLVYDNFYSPDQNGVIGVPTGRTLEGGHAVMIVGYDSTLGAVKFLNSWGSSWNKGGYGFLDQNYFNPNLGLVLSLYSVWLDPSILSS